MARKPRLEFEGAIYHMINRGNYRKDLFLERGAAPAFEEALLGACVIMSNYFHLAIETPEANLVSRLAAGDLCQPLQSIPGRARTCVSKALQEHLD